MILQQLREGRLFSTKEKPEFSLNCDVLVVGLGSAGSLAALAAAEEGSSVIALERGNSCGGMATRGSVNGYYYGCGEGLYRRIDIECARLAEEVFLPTGVFHPHARQYVLEDQLQKNGVTIHYHSFVTGLFMTGQKVTGIRAFLPTGLVDIKCKIVIDATSEGYLVRLTKTNCTFGRATDRKAQPFSSVRVFLRPDGKMARTNHDSGFMNQYDPTEFSKASLAAHALHVNDLGNDETFLFVAEQIGVREGMLFEGEDNLTLADILDQTPVAQPLLYCYSDIDKHGHDIAFDADPYQVWFSLCNLSTVTAQIALPLGCVVPKNIKGLISSGRCLAVDSYASSAIRMQRDMQRLGESCGVLAVMACQTDGDPLAVDYCILKSKLEQRNCFGYDPELSLGFATPQNKDTYTPVKWLHTQSDLISALSSNTPGVALWSSYKLGSEGAAALLLDCLKAEDESLRWHAALALGLAGEKRALPVLRQIVQKRSAFFFEDCRRSNQLRSAIAIALCGRLGDEAILPELCQIISDPAEFRRPIYHQYEKVTPEFSYKFGVKADFNQVYFQHLSHSVTAILRILKQHPQHEQTIRQALAAGLKNCDYIRKITPNQSGSAEYKTALHIREFASLHLPDLFS